MKNMTNEVKLEGYLYQFNLEKKIAAKTGTPYISGKVSIATDEACTNIVDVHYTYVTPVFKSGKENKTYAFLENLIDHPETTVMGGSIATALKVATTGCGLALNEWYDQTGTLISVLRNEGGFIGRTATFTSTPNLFTVDMVVTQAIEVEVPDGEEPKTQIKGIIFGYQNAIMPVSFVMYGQKTQEYWLSLGLSPKTPTLATVWGNIVSNEIKIRKETPNAFGEALVTEEVKTKKEYVVIGGHEPYGFDTEESIYAADLEKLTQQRELFLANMKKQREEYLASKSQSQGFATPAPTVQATTEFNF